MPADDARFNEYLHRALEGHEDCLSIRELTGSGDSARNILDAWIRMDGEHIVSDAGKTAGRRIPISDDLRIALVVADDLGPDKGDRDVMDAAWRFDDGARVEKGFATVRVWTSETPDRLDARRRARAGVYRTVFQRVHGMPETFAQKLRQEGLVQRFLGHDAPPTKDERRIVMENYDAEDFETAFALFYGDEAAERLGYPKLGVDRGAAERVGWALAGDPLAVLDV